MPETLYDYERRSQVAGPLTEPPLGAYRVQYRRLEGARPVRSSLLVLTALLFVGGFLIWLMLPSHWPNLGENTLVDVATVVVTLSTGVIGWFAFLNVATLCRAPLLARDPVPVLPAEGQRVAFLTTIVPQVESLDVVRPTLDDVFVVKTGRPLEGADEPVAAT